ncbi:TrmB family transcriptional regulator [Gottschalkiaceae bacterium SANA]|nr:TrmB family transcriptional regulator [Gottschalkiaceae bacterium SANA]
MINESIINDMKKLGFSAYEVKAYMSLLQQYPVNGYGLSKKSGIPRSRIYEVLNSLEEKQVVFKQEDGDALIYYPLEPKLLIRKLREDLNEIIGRVDQMASSQLNRNRDDQRMIVIKDRQKIIKLLKLLISEAQSRIALSIWDEEIMELMEPLKEAKARGIQIRGIYFGTTLPFSTMTAHRRIDRYLLEKKERHLSVILDGQQVISGVISRGADSRVTWIKDPGFVEMSEDYISHDIMINQYAETLRGQAKNNFETFSDSSRKEYFEYKDEE